MEDNIKKLFDVSSKDIPSSIPIFPLDNVLLLPFGKLPLNIFEERYIKMTLDSLKTHRMIGIIQPKNNNNELFQMGCIGKITSYIETPDYSVIRLKDNAVLLLTGGTKKFMKIIHYLMQARGLFIHQN